MPIFLFLPTDAEAKHAQMPLSHECGRGLLPPFFAFFFPLDSREGGILAHRIDELADVVRTFRPWKDFMPRLKFKPGIERVEELDERE